MRLRTLLLVHWPAALLAAGCGDYRTVEPAPIPVVGRVSDQLGWPVAGQVVAAGDSTIFDRATTTGPDGTFVLQVKRIPYDLALVTSASGVLSQTVVYRGVTRLDPTITLLMLSSGSPASPPPGLRAATLAGTVPAPCDRAACPGGVQSVVAFDPGPTGAFFGWAATGPFDYHLAVSWTGGAARTGRIHALAWAELPASPGQYWYGIAPATAVDGTATTVDLPPLAPPATGPLSGTLSAPPGAVVDSAAIYHTLAQEPVAMHAFTVARPGASFRFDIPAVAAVRTSLVVQGTGAAGESLSAGRAWVVAGNTGLSVDLHAAPALLAPAAGATGVGPGTRVAWTAEAGALGLLWFPPVLVHTAASETVLPDFSALGLAYPAGAAGQWYVTQERVYPGIDAMLAPPPAGPADWWSSRSVAHPFTFR